MRASVKWVNNDRRTSTAADVTVARSARDSAVTVWRHLRPTGRLPTSRICYGNLPKFSQLFCGLIAHLYLFPKFYENLPHNVLISKRERITLRLLIAVADPSVCRLSVCLSVTLVHPTQAVELFGNFFHRTIAQGLYFSGAKNRWWGRPFPPEICV